MTDAEILAKARQILQEWTDRQSHDKCWFAPEVLDKLVKCLGVEATVPANLPPLEEFRDGCWKYQDMLYSDGEPRLHQA